jgi:hypothetical protein
MDSGVVGVFQSIHAFLVQHFGNIGICFAHSSATDAPSSVSKLHELTTWYPNLASLMGRHVMQAYLVPVERWCSRTTMYS